MVVEERDDSAEIRLCQSADSEILKEKTGNAYPADTGSLAPWLAAQSVWIFGGIWALQQLQMQMELGAELQHSLYQERRHVPVM